MKEDDPLSDSFSDKFIGQETDGQQKTNSIREICIITSKLERHSEKDLFEERIERGAVKVFTALKC